MKRFFYFFVLSAIVSGMASCGDGNDPKPEIDNAPEGAISGKFTVDEGKQVYFAQGNLQASYDGGEWKWFFAEHQWDWIGNVPGNTAIDEEGKIPANDTLDLFGWSTDATFFGINQSMENATYSGSFKDWGNTIGNGWYTLSSEEWHHLFFKRNDAAHLFGMGKVNGQNGVIVLPDDWAGEKFTDTDNGLAKGSSIYHNPNGTNFSFHTIDADEWSSMEKQGVVFLPVADFRTVSGVGGLGMYGYYWSSTPVSEDQARSLDISPSSLMTNAIMARYRGHAVRLVHHVK